MSSPSLSVPVLIRRARPEDAEVCGRICYEAFAAINRDHGFPPEIPGPETATGMFEMLFSHQGFYCVVAESGGEITGSNCLDERSPIAGVGPVSVAPGVQNQSIGKRLMQAVLDRSRDREFAGVRLLQSAFHNRSLCLYAKLGFDVKEPVSVMNGTLMAQTVEGCSTRAAQMSDLEACDRLCRSIHGHDRSGELRDSIQQGSAMVAERDGHISGYASAFGYFGHAVAESNTDMVALIAAAPGFSGPGILVPTRNSELFRSLLDSGLRVVQPLTLMTMGMYHEPTGPYLPSILY